MLKMDESNIPIYIQLSQTIRRRIMEGQYQPGDLIPMAKELEKAFGVSDITIRKALDILVLDGIIVRRRGFGTLVTDRGQDVATFDVSGNFLELLDAPNGKPIRYEADVLEIGITSDCPIGVRETLSLGQDESVWRMKRIRKRNSKPISYFINYGRPELFGRIKKKEIQKQTFLKIAAEGCGIPIKKADQFVEATLADMDLSVLLGTNFGAPLFFVVNTYYSNNNNPVAVTHMYFRGDQYKYHTTIKL